MEGFIVGNILETIYDLMLKPRLGFRDITETRSLKQGLLIIVFSTIITTLGMWSGSDFQSKIFLIIIQLFGSLFMWVISAAVFHLIAELLGGSGTVKQLLKATAFIAFLQILLVPVYLLAAFLPSNGAAIIGIATFLISIWSIVLDVLAIQSVYNVSGAKATLIFLLPLLVFIGGIMLLFIVAGSFLATAASNLFLNPPQF